MTTAFTILIDYDNLQPAQKMTGILDIVTKVLLQIPVSTIENHSKCNVRLYGGWYEDTRITRLAEDVLIEVQRDFPKVVHVVDTNGSRKKISVSAELAVAMLQEPGHHLFNTFRRKGKPSNIIIREKAEVGCTDSDCILPLMRKLMKNGICPKAGCIITVDDLVYRHEQKIVDTMLSCDLIYAANSGLNPVILVSGDDDFLPPLRTILLGGSSAIRFLPKPNNNQQAFFPQDGPQLLEKDL